MSHMFETPKKVRRRVGRGERIVPEVLEECVRVVPRSLVNTLNPKLIRPKRFPDISRLVRMSSRSSSSR
jgi:hypothetical protein